MKKLHKMLLAVVILTAMTAVGTWMVSSHKPDTLVYSGSVSSEPAIHTLSSSCIRPPHVQQVHGTLIHLEYGCLGDASDSCAQPSAVIPPPASVSKLLSQGIYARLGRVSPHASTKGHRNQLGVFSCAGLYAPAAPLLYAPAYIIASSTDPILDIPLNRGPTS